MTRSKLVKNDPFGNDPFGISDFLGKTANDLFSFDFLQSDFPLRENPSFPPYNITRSTDGDEYIISIALAGLERDDIDVTVSNNKLTVSHEASEEKSDENQEFIHRGIAKRSFRSVFRLPKNSEVSDCSLTNGMLSITITKYESRDDDFKRIEIN